jgi:ATP-binding cassette, subfamily B, bacterial PglK
MKLSHIFKIIFSSLGYLKFLLVTFISVSSGLLDSILVIAIYPALQVYLNPDVQGNEQGFGYNFVSNILANDTSVSVFLLLLIIITSVGLKFLTQYIIAKYGHQIGLKLSANILDNLLRGDFEKARMLDLSTLVSTLGRKSNETVGSVIVPCLTLASLFVSLLIIFTSLSFMFGKVVIILTFLVAIFFLILYLLFLPITKLVGRDYADLQNDNILNITESYWGTREVRLYKLASVYIQKFKKTDWLLRAAQIKIHLVAITPRMLIEAIISCFALLIPLLVVKANIDINTFTPFAGVAGMLVLRVLPQISNLYSSFVSVQGGLPSLLDMLNLGADLQEQRPQFQWKKTRLTSIKLTNANYKYDYGRRVFENSINLEIKAGQKLAIVGTNGAGKSTLLDLIMGLIKPNDGQIQIYGDSKLITHDQILIALVPQQIIINRGSLRENIELGWVHNISEMHKVLEKVGLGYFSLDTQIDEGGRNLSGGQRQRIGIARAILKAPDLLILDEFTSSIDTETSLNIFELVKSLDCTVVVVSHNLLIQKYVDTVINLNQLKSVVGEADD